MQRHVHISQEVHEELECLVCLVIVRIPAFAWESRRTLFHPVLQDLSGVPDASENVYATPAFPTFISGEKTRLLRIVTHSTDVVERRRPPHLEANLVCPGRNGRQMAERLRRIRGRVVEKVADVGKYTRVEVNLRDSCDYFVTYDFVFVMMCSA